MTVALTALVPVLLTNEQKPLLVHAGEKNILDRDRISSS